MVGTNEVVWILVSSTLKIRKIIDKVWIIPEDSIGIWEALIKKEAN